MLTAFGKAINIIKGSIGVLGYLFERMISKVTTRLPKGLYARSLLIIIMPMVLLQLLMAYFFMERHWQLVTRRLSAALTQEIGMLTDLHEKRVEELGSDWIEDLAQRRLGLDVDFLPFEPLPPPVPVSYFDILGRRLSVELDNQIGKPFWIDTVGKASLIEIRIQLENTTMRVFARRSQAYASNSHIFIVWMVLSSLVLLLVAILFLRNQIKPILSLTNAVEDFGKGREVDFRLRGAREVRQAGRAFLEMKRRIERSLEQRTTMLNGVSHDLRTVLTRFRLSLAFFDESPELDDLKRDVEEMQRMVEAYLAFARGDAGEQAAEIDIRALLEELRQNAEREGHDTHFSMIGDGIVVVRPDAIRRLLGNLVSNAARYGKSIEIRAIRGPRYLTISIEDDGPGIPEGQWEEVFRPFLRLDESRNQNHVGTGLGLAIARDIARSHGGDVILGDSPLGGLMASVKIPV